MLLGVDAANHRLHRGSNAWHVRPTSCIAAPRWGWHLVAAEVVAPAHNSLQNSNQIGITSTITNLHYVTIYVHVSTYLSVKDAKFMPSKHVFLLGRDEIGGLLALEQPVEMLNSRGPSLPDSRCVNVSC